MNSSSICMVVSKRYEMLSVHCTLMQAFNSLDTRTDSSLLKYLLMKS